MGLGPANHRLLLGMSCVGEGTVIGSKPSPQRGAQPAPPAALVLSGGPGRALGTCQTNVQEEHFGRV